MSAKIKVEGLDGDPVTLDLWDSTLSGLPFSAAIFILLERTKRLSDALRAMDIDLDQILDHEGVVRLP